MALLVEVGVFRCKLNEHRRYYLLCTSKKNQRWKETSHIRILISLSMFQARVSSQTLNSRGRNRYLFYLKEILQLQSNCIQLNVIQVLFQTTTAIYQSVRVQGKDYHDFSVIIGHSVRFMNLGIHNGLSIRRGIYGAKK